MISKVFSISACTSSFLYTSYVLYNLMHFLSRHNVQKTPIRYHTDDSLILQSIWRLFIDASLLSIFMLQHSLMKHDLLKQVFVKLHLEDIERSIYNACSAGVLHLLIDKWILVPQVSIWSIDTSTNNTLWLVFTILHVVGWSIIFSGCLIMDISELAGLKQVYYKMSGRSSPMLFKSRELQRYFVHMRHPSFTGFFIILWMHPFMTMDRVLLGLILTVYMILMWTIDDEDYDYHVKMMKQKQRERW